MADDGAGAGPRQPAGGHGAHAATDAAVVEVAALPERIAFYLNLQLAASLTGTPLELPPEVAQIAELGRRLPHPSTQQWAHLAGRRVRAAVTGSGGGAQARSGGGAGGSGAPESGKRHRQSWTEESRAELVRLVEDEAYREQVLGRPALNWAAISRHLGFGGGPVVHKKYNQIKGIAPPLAAKPKGGAGSKGEGPAEAQLQQGGKAEGQAGAQGPASEGEAAGGAEEGGELEEEAGEEEEHPPAAKKAKGAPAPAGPAERAAPAGGGGGGWSPAQSRELLRLATDETYRRQVFGKSKLKWSRLAEHLGCSKGEARRKFSELTGEAAE